MCEKQFVLFCQLQIICKASITGETLLEIAALVCIKLLFGFMCNVPFFDRAMQDKTFSKSARLQWLTNYAFFLRTLKKVKPKCETDLPCALKLDPPRTYISQMRKQTPLRPQFTQVLMCMQDYISSPLSPSSSWFLPYCTESSTSPDPGLHFWLLSRRLPWQSQQSQAPVPTLITDIAWVSGLGVSWLKPLGTETNQKAEVRLK